VPGFRSLLLSGHWAGNFFRSNSHQSAKRVALWGSRVGPLRPAPAHSGYSFHDGMDLCFAPEFKSLGVHCECAEAPKSSNPEGITQSGGVGVWAANPGPTSLLIRFTEELRRAGAARWTKRHSYLFRLTPFIELVGNSEYSVSYKSAIGFGVYNPTFLKCLEGL